MALQDQINAALNKKLESSQERKAGGGFLRQKNTPLT